MINYFLKLKSAAVINNRSIESISKAITYHGSSLAPCLHGLVDSIDLLNVPYRFPTSVKVKPICKFWSGKPGLLRTRGQWSDPRPPRDQQEIDGIRQGTLQQIHLIKMVLRVGGSTLNKAPCVKRFSPQNITRNTCIRKDKDTVTVCRGEVLFKEPMKGHHD